jgi:hypothetical protein
MAGGVANRKPIFVGEATTSFTAIPATANTNRDGTGTITAIYNAPSATGPGSLIESIKVQANVTTAAGVLNLFISSDGGSTWKLIADLLVTAITPSTTVAAWSGYFAGEFLPLTIPPNASYKLGISTTIAQSFTALVKSGSLENKDTAPIAQ